MTTFTRMGTNPPNNTMRTFLLDTGTGEHRIGVVSVFGADGTGNHDDMVLCLTHGEMFRHKRQYGNTIAALNQTAAELHHFGEVRDVNEWVSDENEDAVKRTDIDYTDWRL